MSEQRETPAPALATIETGEPHQTNGAAVEAPAAAPAPVNIAAVEAAAPAPAPAPVTAPAPAPDPAPAPAPVNGAAAVDIKPNGAPHPEINAEEPPPVIRMRNPAIMNGQQLQQASINGHAAVQRGLEALADTEAAQNNEEIKKLDTQLDHFNKYMDKFEKKNSELTERLSTLLQSQKEERLKRRASFMQREEEMKTEQDSFDNQLKNMFAKCAQMRRNTAPVIESGVDSMLEQSRKIREGTIEAPIHEANGHDEPEATAN